MTEIRTAKYTMSFREKFSAARSIDDVLTGHVFRVDIRCSTYELRGGEVVPREHLRSLVKTLDNQNLNMVMEPGVPTTENLARFIGQAVLDYLFRMEMEKTVMVDSVTVYEDKRHWACIAYQYAEG